MNEDVLKEYLVKISARLDQHSFKLTTANLLNLAGNFANIKAGLSVATKATGLFVGAMFSAAKSAYRFVNSFAQTDNEMYRFARNMFTTKENAYSLNQALDTMGKTFDDLYTMTPEEWAQFNELRKTYDAIGKPKDYSATMRGFRGFIQDIQKMQITLKAFFERVAYYFIKYLQKPLARIGSKLTEWRKKFTANIDKYAERIGRIGDVVGRVAEVILTVIEYLGKIVNYVNEKLPASTKGFLAVATAVGLAIVKGPLGWILLALTAIILLIDDFLTWKRGGKSLLGDFWGQIEDLEFGDTFTDLIDSLTDILNLLAKIAKSEVVKWVFSEAFKISIASLKLALDGVRAVLQLIADALQTIYDIITLQGIKDSMDYFSRTGTLRSQADTEERGRQYSEQMQNFSALTTTPAGQNNINIGVNVDKDGGVTTKVDANGDVAVSKYNSPYAVIP